MTRIVVVGDLVTDIVVRTDSAISASSDTPAQISTSGGGAAANTACWLGEAGADVALVARVGADEAGRARSLELFAYGVDGRLSTDPAAPTGTVVVLVDQDGQRSMLADRGASARLQPRDLPADLFSPRAHLHLSGYTLLHPDSRDAGLHALALARGAGMSVSVDAASAAPLAEVGAASFLSWTAGADLLLANADEADVLSARSDARSAAEALTADYPHTVVKAGAAGSCWAMRSGAVHTCAAAPTRVLDTTGAGDAFAAGLLAEWLTPGATAGSALAAAAALAARAVTRPGGRPAQD